MVVVASGNNNQNTDKTLSYPANYNLDNIISVAAVDSNGRLPYFTNFGKTNVDLLAPGVDILSTQAGGGYQNMSGTSQATAFVSGVAALIKAQNPEADYKVLKEKLLSSVKPNPYFKDKSLSSGNLNALAALMPEKPLIKVAENLAITAFTDEKGNIIKDTSCMLCGSSRILCGNIDQVVKNYKEIKAEEMAFREVCKRKNQKLESKEKMKSLHESEITYYTLRSELFTMASSEEDKRLLLENGFRLSDLIKNLGWDTYNKLRSIYMLLPVLDKSDFNKHAEHKSNHDNHYAKYLEDLINTASPYLEHKGHGLFRYTVYSSPVITERISNLMPIDQFMVLDKVNFDSVSSYKQGIGPKGDKDLVDSTLKALDMPKVKDIKEARKQVYLKLNEHHLAEDQLSELLPKKYASSQVLKNHISATMSDPVSFISNKTRASMSRASFGSVSRGAGASAKRHSNILDRQREKAKAANQEIKKLPSYQAIKKQEKVSNKEIAKTLRFRSMENVRGNERPRDFVRMRPNFIGASRQRNLSYMKAENADTTSKRLARDYKRQKRKMTSGGRPRAVRPYIPNTAKVGFNKSNYSSSSSSRSGGNNAIRSAKASPKVKPKTREQALDEKLDAPMERQSLNTEQEKGPSVIKFSSEDEFQNSKISCESMQWQQLVYQIDDRNPALKEEDCFPERPVDICGKTRRAREYTRRCVNENLKPASCFNQIHMDVANICNQ